MTRGSGARRPRAKAKVVKLQLVPATPPPETPLSYMLAVMRDPKADDARRDAMAIAAVRFVHGLQNEDHG